MNVDMANADIPYIGGRQNEIDLSGLGRYQAADLGHYAVAARIEPTDFYSSPANRTKQTHTISSTVMGLTVEAILDDRLQELDQGSWTNQPRSLYDEPANKAEIARLQADFAPAGGESMNMVYRRTDEFLGDLVTDTGANETRHVWVHTHGVVIKTYVGKMLGWSHEQTYQTGVDNASLTRLVHDGSGWRLLFFNHSTAMSGRR